MSPTNRPLLRLLPLLAAGALVAALLLIQLPSLLGVRASVKTTVGGPCTSARIQAPPAAPQQPGTTVTLQGFAGGCGSPEFKFLLLAPGTSTWVAKTGYTSTASYTWITTGAKQGVWQIGVWVRAAGSTATYQSYALGTYSLITPYCTSAAISYGATITVTNVDLTLTATATICTLPLFEWRELSPGSSTWRTVQAYATPLAGGDTFHLVIPLPSGAYRFVVEAKQAGSSHSYDTYDQLTFWP